MSEPLAQRAARAAALINQHRSHNPHHRDRAEHLLRARLRLAALLGLPLPRITAPEPTPVHGRRPVMLTATDPADPRTRLHFYLPDATRPDATFYAIAPCPGCTNPVPLIPVTVLADIAPLLTRHPAARSPRAPHHHEPVFTTHPAHRPTCPLRARATLPRPRTA